MRVPARSAIFGGYLRDSPSRGRGFGVPSSEGPKIESRVKGG
jgi:hypothetical protein